MRKIKKYKFKKKNKKIYKFKFMNINFDKLLIIFFERNYNNF